MRRRLTIAIVGMSVATLFFTGVGTIALASIGSRADDEQDLREQVEAFSELFGELTFAPAGDDTAGILRRLQRVAESISVDGVGLLVVPRNTELGPVGELPAGVELEDLDLDALRAGETISERDGDLIWAARGVTNRQGVPALLLLAEEPDSIVLPAFPWFLLAGGATILIGGLLSVRLSGALTKPVIATEAVTSRLAQGELDARVDIDQVGATGEVAALVASVNTMAESLERSKTLERHFLLSISHDLRTPLTSIKGYAEALSDGAVDDPARVGAVLEGEANRLDRLVGDLLLLARLESTDFPLNRHVVDLGPATSAATAGLERDATERGVALITRVPDDAAWASIDPDRYTQIVTNLVANALRFARSEVVVTLWYAEGRHHLAVGDDGPGIADDDLPHVFERLYVAKHNPAVKESGSGLGLAIVRDLTERMGGSVTARRSTLGGAELVVSFPPAQQPER